MKLDTVGQHSSLIMDFKGIVLHHCSTSQMSFCDETKTKDQEREKNLLCMKHKTIFGLNFLHFCLTMNRPSGDHLHRMSIAVTSPFQLNDACTYFQLFCLNFRIFFLSCFHNIFLFPLHLVFLLVHQQ